MKEKLPAFIERLNAAEENLERATDLYMNGEISLPEYNARTNGLVRLDLREAGEKLHSPM